MSNYLIPRSLDKPYRVLFWTIDECIVAIVPFLFFWLLWDSPLTGMAISGVLLTLLRKLKGKDGEAYLLQLVYWHLPPFLKLRVIPPSYQRIYLG